MIWPWKASWCNSDKVPRIHHDHNQIGTSSWCTLVPYVRHCCPHILILSMSYNLLVISILVYYQIWQIYIIMVSNNNFDIYFFNQIWLNSPFLCNSPFNHHSKPYPKILPFDFIIKFCPCHSSALKLISQWYPFYQINHHGYHCNFVTMISGGIFAFWVPPRLHWGPHLLLSGCLLLYGWYCSSYHKVLVIIIISVLVIIVILSSHLFLYCCLLTLGWKFSVYAPFLFIISFVVIIRYN